MSPGRFQSAMSSEYIGCNCGPRESTGPRRQCAHDLIWIRERIPPYFISAV